MNSTMFVQLAADALTLGLLYALVAIGLTLIWGVIDIVNFAHGEFLVVAMYMGFFTYALWGLSSIVAMPFAVVLLGAMGWAVYKIIISKVMRGGNLLSQIVVTFGLSVFLQSLFLFLFSGDYRAVDHDPWLRGDVHIAGAFLSLAQVVISGLSLLLIFAVNVFIKQTNTGKAIIASSLDREAAQLMGINTDRMNAITFSIGIATLGVGGVVLPVITHVSPFSGFLFAVLAFTIVALGGFGSVMGTILAGLLVGLVETFGGFFLGPQYKYLCIFVLYLIVLTVRPRGIFGW